MSIQRIARSLRARLAPVRVRVTLIATVIVASALIVGALALVALLRAEQLRSLSGSGPEHAAELAAVAARGPLPDPLPPLLSPRLTVLQVVGADGRVIAASSQLAGQPALTTPSNRRRVVDEIADLGQGPWLVEPTPATIANRPVTVVVITSMAELSRSAKLVAGLLFAGVPILVLLSATAVWIVVGRSLRPVEKMRTQVADIAAHQLDRRVELPIVDDEVARLGSTLNDMLERLELASTRQRQFVADASHDLRTPIANIRVAVEIAAAHPERADWSAIATDVLRQNARMERMVLNLLTIARLDAGQMTQRFEPVDLTALVRATAAEFASQDPRIVVIEPMASATVEADRDQLTRVLTNLVDNALRYATDVVAITLLAGAGWAELAVSDDGPGIPRDQRERVFDRFVRLDESRAAGSGGAGLGLAIVRQLVEAQHGLVTIADTGRGATLVVRLPLTRRHQPRRPAE